MKMLKKIPLSMVATSLLLMILASPVYAAWSSVTADALVSFSNYSYYYKVNATSKITASGTRSSGESINNFIWITKDGATYYTKDSLGTTNPSTLSWTSGQEGDSITWGCDSIGEIYRNGVPSGITDRDYHYRTHPGM